MSDNKNEIEQLVKEFPRHFAQKIKRNPKLFSEIEAFESESNNIAEQTFQYLNPSSNRICPISNKPRRFKSISEGYGFCGKAINCQCAKNSVSEKISKQKKLLSDDQKVEILKKREQTNLKKYKVKNVGQTKKAKESHSRFYQDKEKVSDIQKRIEETNIQKYGVKNPMQVKEISQKSINSWKEKYGNNLSCFYDKETSEVLLNKDRFAERFNQAKSIDTLAEEIGVSVTTIYRYSEKYGLRNKFKSMEEQEVEQFLLSLLPNDAIIRNSRKIISKELDFYLPEYNLAIDYNGLYWHHDLIEHVDKYYHQKKFVECEQKGIHLITLFSDQWKLKKEIVQQRLKHKLGISNTIYARKCRIVEVESKEANKFYESTHIQGALKSSIVNYGLVYNEDLVACIGFSKLRKSLGLESKDECYELTRYSTTGSVVGGLSRLFRKFISEYNTKEIISYSDNCWNSGNAYSKLGFELVKENTPGYWWVLQKEKRNHRFSFRKDELIKQGFDPLKTEEEIMYERGALRIWDCGSRKWRWCNE